LPSLAGCSGSRRSCEHGPLPSDICAVNGLQLKVNATSVLPTSNKLRLEYAKKLAKRKEEEKIAEELRQAAIQRADEALREHLAVSGDPQKFIDMILASIRADDKVLQTYSSGEVSEALVNTYRNKIKRRQFEGIYSKAFPYRMSERQKREAIECMMSSNTYGELADAHNQMWHRDLYSKAVMSCVEKKSPEFHCSICLDPLVSSTVSGYINDSQIWFPPLRKTEHWTNHPCGHAHCRSCLGKWAETAINDQKLRIKCPAEGCSYSLWDQDLRELVSPDVFARHQEHKNADYLHHLKKMTNKDSSLKIWLKSHARPCPDCHVIVSRSEGCDHMTCVCGTRFCYACGFKSCKCKSKGQIEDIWNPTA